MHWILHVTGGDNGAGPFYLEESGFVALVASVVPIWIGLFVFIRKHNCHVERCWRLQWSDHPEHGHPVCKHHHPHGGLITEKGLES